MTTRKFNRHPKSTSQRLYFTKESHLVVAVIMCHASSNVRSSETKNFSMTVNAEKHWYMSQLASSAHTDTTLRKVQGAQSCTALPKPENQDSKHASLKYCREVVPIYASTNPAQLEVLCRVHLARLLVSLQGVLGICCQGSTGRFLSVHACREAHIIVLIDLSSLSVKPEKHQGNSAEQNRTANASDYATDDVLVALA